jgi:hypothetical protein
MKKIILGLGIVIVVLVVVGAIVAGTHLGDIIKAGVETAGPKITQTTVTVDSVNVSLLAGSAGVNGLVLGNPQGYKSPTAISIGKAAVSLSPGSIFADKIVIHSLEVRAAEITFEGNPLGANNLTQIMNNVNPATAAADQSTNAPASATPAEKKAARKLQVDDLLIAGAKVHANLTGLVNQPIDLTLPDIHLTNLGQGADGITAADLTQKVLNQVTADTIKALVSAAGDLGKNAANAAKAAAQNAVNGVLQNGSNTVGQGVDQLKKSLGGLLGK